MLACEHRVRLCIIPLQREGENTKIFPITNIDFANNYYLCNKKNKEVFDIVEHKQILILARWLVECHSLKKKNEEQGNNNYSL